MYARCDSTGRITSLHPTIWYRNSFYYETETTSDIYQNIFAPATFQYIFKFPVFSEYIVFLSSKSSVGIFPTNQTRKQISEHELEKGNR